MTELLAFMALNPWLSFFMGLLVLGFIAQTLSMIRDMYIHTVWAIRGIVPIAPPKVDVTELDAAKDKITKKEDDENKLKDCR